MNQDQIAAWVPVAYRLVTERWKKRADKEADFIMASIEGNDSIPETCKPLVAMLIPILKPVAAGMYVEGMWSAFEQIADHISPQQVTTLLHALAKDAPTTEVKS